MLKLNLSNTDLIQFSIYKNEQGKYVIQDTATNTKIAVPEADTVYTKKDIDAVINNLKDNISMIRTCTCGDVNNNVIERLTEYATTLSMFGENINSFAEQLNELKRNIIQTKDNGEYGGYVSPASFSVPRLKVDQFGRIQEISETVIELKGMIPESTGDYDENGDVIGEAGLISASNNAKLTHINSLSYGDIDDILK